MTETTLVILKPDATHRALLGELVQRFERTGLQIVAMRMTTPDHGEAAQHYARHSAQPYYKALCEFTMSGPVVLLVLYGPDAVAICRDVQARARADFTTSRMVNLVHAADSVDEASREIGVWFEDDEIDYWTRDTTRWHYCTQDE